MIIKIINKVIRELPPKGTNDFSEMFEDVEDTEPIVEIFQWLESTQVEQTLVVKDKEKKKERWKEDFTKAI